ncbi:serine hydrolase [Aeromicrobium sp. 636]|uniref:Beta-lactamase family protein n=1 Tax=Aeromicrobium senzhongii TaxID=2663859 RepID=A0A8I0EUU9_9ACTN|nr:serine hydrolase domain-containing protein [Aeromicrobium sp. 636]MBC9225497.1 beta-lactamase family protein [Aeromicrobium senzhongii]MCQ3997607.1 serine hydrolase [Aeromicrobium sp. 636]
MSAFDDLLLAEQEASGQASVTAALVRDGALQWSGAVGTVDGRDGAPATPATAYRIGSITKTFVAVEVMRLRDEGRLDLADRIDRHLPDVPFGHVTIAQLLSHTSGLQAETNGPWWERTPGGDWDELIGSGLELVHTPGTRFHYSNVGFAVLGRLVAVLRGTSWFDAVRVGILEPLGMQGVTLQPGDGAAVGLSHHPLDDRLMVEPHHDAGAMAPAGQLWAGAEELARWAAFAAGDTGDVLSAATWAEMVVPLAVDDRPGVPWATAQALGWRIWPGNGSGRLIGHGGSMPGFLATAIAEPESGWGVVVLTNDTLRLGDLATGLLEAARMLDQRPTPATAVEPAPDVADLVGDWFWGPVPYRLEATADGFHLSDAMANRRSRFVRDGDGWRGLDTYFAGERLVVRPDGALDLASFILSREPYDPAVAHPGGLDPRGWH